MRSHRSFLVRTATAADIDQVVAIERLAFGDPWTRSSFASLIGNPTVVFRVADESRGATGGVAGYAVAWYAADEAELANLAVAPAARQCGVGALLLDAVLDAVTRRGAATTYLEVRESNTTARALYASRGFVELGRRRGYYRNPAEDALVLGRRSPLDGTDAVRSRVETPESA